MICTYLLLILEPLDGLDVSELYDLLIDFISVNLIVDVELLNEGLLLEIVFLLSELVLACIECVKAFLSLSLFIFDYDVVFFIAHVCWLVAFAPLIV